ncbi:S24/S26 family peptidase [Actinosynnema pretiosum]|uniref:S26 family signal peptidase n=1 Tax=Actinosynnema pretiosum TaxID=42197 RepID=A0A290Z3R7_9PSEU|nr:S24/S26 family peptidase [Actinosynnema pretiosum]ATE53647.1 hypothetical protein CNX65_10395 [Actinosynnema pretiosum]
MAWWTRVTVRGGSMAPTLRDGQRLVARGRAATHRPRHPAGSSPRARATAGTVLSRRDLRPASAS